MFIGNSRIALNAHRNFTLHNKNMNKALVRLSSGLRINSAADDPAGLAISEKMKMQLTLLKNDKYESLNKISALDVADGAMNEVQNMLNRMLELAELSTNEIYSETDRENMNKEYQQLLDEINRIGAGTKFNSYNLFGNGNGTSNVIQGLVDKGTSIKIGSSNLKDLLDGLDDFLSKVSGAAATNDEEALLSMGIDRSNGKTDAENLKEAVNNYIKNNAEELKGSDTSISTEETKYTIAFKGGQVTVKFPELSDASLGLKGTDILTKEGAEKALAAAKTAINRLSAMRGDNGAMRNKLEHTVSLLDQMSVNLTDSLSRILDADMAEEMMNFIKAKFLSQASMFVMAHANQESDQVIKLLGTM